MPRGVSADMDPATASTATAAAGLGGTFWLSALLLVAVIAYLAGGVSGGRRGVTVRRRTRGHVRRAAGEARRFLFAAADALAVDADAGEVEFANGARCAVGRVAVVDRGLHLDEGRAIRVTVGEGEGRGAGGEEGGGEAVRGRGAALGPGFVDRVLKFPSRRAVDAFLDALVLAQRKEDEAARPEAVTVSLSTWNVGNAQPPSDLSSWIDKTRASDIVAIGTQECSYTVKRETDEGVEGGGTSAEENAAVGERGLGDIQQPTLEEMADMSSNDIGSRVDAHLSGKEHWQALVSAYFPKSDYVNIAELASWDRCLSVYVKKELADAVSHVRNDVAFVGLGGVAGNKGAIGVRFSMYDTDFVIVNSHLAAHQGNVVRRNQDFQAIVNSLRALRDGPLVDALTSTVHHVFWVGDLNYRIDLPREDVITKVGEEDFSFLASNDQLVRARASGDAFVGFDEAEIAFAPTYRYERGNRKYASTKMRIPSYCDRVLKRSLPGLRSTFEQYEAVNTILTSDHNPVVATARAELLHRVGMVKADEIGGLDVEAAADAAAAAAAAARSSDVSSESVSRGVPGDASTEGACGSNAGASSPQGVIAGALMGGLPHSSSSSIDAPVLFQVEFERLSAIDLPEMDGASQLAAAKIVSGRVVSGGAPASSDADYGTMSVTEREASVGQGGDGPSSSGDTGAESRKLNSRGLCDPYCVFHGEAVAELSSGQFETHVRKETQNPSWSRKMLPLVGLIDSSLARLRRRYLTITVMDEDVGSADDIVGSVVLWMGDGALDDAGDGIVSRVEFEQEILYSGIARGKLSGSYVVRRTR